MAADIFGHREDADVDAGRERGEQQGRRPGIVEQRDDPALARRGADRRHVLDLHRQAAGAFEQDRAGLLAEQLADAGADQRIVIGRRDSEALEDRVAIFARRTVGAVGDQQLVAGRQHRGQRGGHRGQARGIERGSCRARLEQGQRLRQRPMGGGPLQAVTIFAERRLAALHLGNAVEQDRRGALDRRIDEAAAPFLAPAAVDDGRLRLPVVAGHRRALAGKARECASFAAAIPATR